QVVTVQVVTVQVVTVQVVNTLVVTAGIQAALAIHANPVLAVDHISGAVVFILVAAILAVADAADTDAHLRTHIQFTRKSS
ncbi:MAG: hypothetical protein ACOYBR_10915, partial [Fluviibacter sp.]